MVWTSSSSPTSVSSLTVFAPERCWEDLDVVAVAALGFDRSLVATVADAAVHHVSFIAGYSAHKAPLPPTPDAPGVWPFQLAQLRVALPWFARLVGA